MIDGTADSICPDIFAGLYLLDRHGLQNRILGMLSLDAFVIIV